MIYKVYYNYSKQKHMIGFNTWDDECYLMDKQNFSLSYDESKKTLRLIDNISGRTVLLLNESGQIVISVVPDEHYDWIINGRVANMIRDYCRVVFGKTVWVMRRYGKVRVYIYPDMEGYINWDTNPLVDKYVLDEQDVKNNPILILDMHTMKVLHGASEQKNQSNKKKPVVLDDKGQVVSRRKNSKESEW